MSFPTSRSGVVHRLRRSFQRILPAAGMPSRKPDDSIFAFTSWARIHLGVWDCGAGKLWIDNVRLVEEPLVNLVRRPGCPLVVQDADGPTIHAEGRDFAELRDPQLGVTPWACEFDVYHEPGHARRRRSCRRAK